MDAIVLEKTRAPYEGPPLKRLRLEEGRRRHPLQSMIVMAVVIAFLATIVVPAVSVSATPTPTHTPLDPNTIPKWVNQITGPPPVYVPYYGWDCKTGKLTQYYQVTATELNEQMLPAPFPKTHVFGYGGFVKDAVTGKFLGYIANSPGPSFNAIKEIPINVEYINNIHSSEFLAVDPTIMWANPNGMTMPAAPFLPFPTGYAEAQSPVPISTHLHGGEVQSTSDGGPLAWYTANGIHGPDYNTYLPAPANAAWDHYPNEQQGATLWYHDHAMGLSRINVYSGMAGFYLLKDPCDKVERLLPSGKYDVPLAIQDRNFFTDGSLDFPVANNLTGDHPYWIPEFFGNTITVNGLVWPNMNVDQGEYRFRLLDDSNARFYNLSFEVQGTGKLLPFKMIGTEGGFLQHAVTLTKTLIAPGQRDDILVDFSKLAPGTRVIVKNDAAAPYPMGSPDTFDPNTVGQIIQFTVQHHKGFHATPLPQDLNPTLKGKDFPTLKNPIVTRNLTLYEVDDPVSGAPIMFTLNGQSFDAPVSEIPKVGTTEEWTIINLTPDAHPIHLHLVMFQVESRQDFDVAKYTSDWLTVNQNIGPPPWETTPKTFSADPYLVPGTKTTPLDIEKGWKDTFIAYPGQVSKIVVRFTEQSGKPFPFDATNGPGYVWHCHIADHEDNGMMRPYVLTK
jgi:spore coat protein A